MERGWFDDSALTAPSQAVPSQSVPAGSTQLGSTAAPGRYRLRLLEVTSVVFLTHRRARTYTGELTELHDRYRRVLMHNLVLGWWGIPFGLIWTPVALVRNHKARAALRELAGQSAGATVAGGSPFG
jgi:hypothetical protein